MFYTLEGLVTDSRQHPRDRVLGFATSYVCFHSVLFSYLAIRALSDNYCTVLREDIVKMIKSGRKHRFCFCLFVSIVGPDFYAPPKTISSKPLLSLDDTWNARCSGVAGGAETHTF